MTKLTEKIGKMWEDKTGVSPIIAVILMVAITVVLAATIYVWVSGFGGGGDETPSMACRADNAADRLVVVSADVEMDWSDITIYNLTDGATNTEIDPLGNITRSTGDTISSTDSLVKAGDYYAATGKFQLVYDPTNSVIGTWTVV
ncbi:MAG: type IV pilin [Candidatus Thermoplasmatota archaeon]|nr:type IV pilin [Candidatus Thermoplasmatota archaeon]MDD5777908.1 type IV pilin [Candidatus Thermoplasmatota archaeon]